MKAFTSFVLAALVAVALGYPTVQVPVMKRDAPDSFLIKPAGYSSAAGRGYVQWDGTIGGNLGWFPSDDNAKDAKVFIQYNKPEGIAFYARDTAVQVYLKESSRPSCQYEARIGNPGSDLTNNFTLDTGSGTEYFGYLHTWDHSWSACGGADEPYILCYGESRECGDTFSLQTEHQS